MLTLDFKSRIRNKSFWVGMISAVVLLVQQLGFKDLVPANYANVVNTVLTILTMIGVIVDPTTIGVSDKIEVPSSTDTTIVK